MSSTMNRDRVYYDEKSGNFNTIPNFRGNVIKLGTVVVDHTKNIDSKHKKKRICEPTHVDINKTLDLIDKRMIVSVQESSGFLCIEYY